MSEKSMIQVENLADCSVVFIDDNNGMKRRIEFLPGQKREIEKDALERLYYTRGGAVLLRDFLSVKDDTLASSFGVPSDQIEYKWSRKDVDNCLLNGSNDALEDALDFAPEAIVEQLINRAVALKINNVQKRDLIMKHTGVNVDNMIKNQEYVQKLEQENKKTPVASARRVQENKTENATPTGRRVQQN